MPAITALPSLSDSPDRLQPVVALVEMQNLVHADHAVVVTNDPELDLNTHAHPNGCRCCSGQPIRRRRRELPQICQALTCSPSQCPTVSVALAGRQPGNQRLTSTNSF